MPITRSDKEPELLQFTDKTVIQNPRFFYKIYEGYGYAASHRFEGVADDATGEIYLENPSGSGKEIFIVAIDVISTGQGWVDIYRDNTVIASGTAITPVNLNFEKAYASVASVEHSGTYTTGDQVHGSVVPGGARVRAVGGAAEVGESVVVPEDYNFLIRVTNKSGSAADMSIRILWWED